MAYVNSLLLSTFIIISYHWTVSSAAALKSTFTLSEDTYWINNNQSLPSTIHFTDNSVARFILLHERQDFGFGFCFHCLYSSSSCYLSTVLVEMSNGTILPIPPQRVWCANPGNPVREHAILNFTNGSLVLLMTSRKGSEVWSTYTTGLVVSHMNITKQGNLMLFTLHGEMVWQSFDHLRDTLFDGQILREGQLLVSKDYLDPINMRCSGLFYSRINSGSLSAFVEGDKPTRYLDVTPVEPAPEFSRLKSVEFRKGKIIFSYVVVHNIKKITLTTSSSGTVQFLRLDTDGGLRIYGWEAGKRGTKVIMFLGGLDECAFPLQCGRYGLCQEGSCSCPVGIDGVQYFIPNSDLIRFGCHQIYDPPSQDISDSYQLINFGNLSSYHFFDKSRAVRGLEDEDGCIRACSTDSSCKAAFFSYDMEILKGYCYLSEDVLSLRKITTSSLYYSSSHIKVLVHSPPYQASKASISLRLVLSATFAGVLALVVTVTIVLMVILRKKQMDDWKYHESDETLKQVIETPMRFSYRELSMATAKFSEKLGRGGFGTVFKGVLKDGTVVAVKRLDRSGQGTKEFRAEVETIGNIHHINLVRLIGFCATRRNRMLVYEYMSNGSLDRWIFCGNKNATLGWEMKKKIVIDIAKGLTYLHEECKQKIAHLDVKPQNILLDDNFNAKLSDFGMSKLISRDESQVITGIRGTLGYLAPEWQHSRITVKADIYSFGIVLLEIISGRKILDYSQPDSDVHLLSLFRKKACENRLMDMVEFKDGDRQGHMEEAIEMIKLGMWCLNGDYTRRPSMSLVVKILEGGCLLNRIVSVLSLGTEYASQLSF